MRSRENTTLASPQFGARSLACAAAVYLLHLVLAGRLGWPGANLWLGLPWAIVFNITIVCTSKLSAVRLAAGSALISLSLICMAQARGVTETRYVLSISVFVFLTLLIVWLCRFPAWSVGSDRGPHDRKMTIRGILAVTTLVAFILVARRDYGLVPADAVWLVLDQMTLAPVLLVASLAGLARRLQPLWMLGIAASLIAGPLAKLLLFHLQMRFSVATAADYLHNDWYLLNDGYLHNYWYLLPLYAVAAFSTFVFNWCGRLDRDADAASAVLPDVEPAVENRD